MTEASETTKPPSMLRVVTALIKRRNASLSTPELEIRPRILYQGSRRTSLAGGHGGQGRARQTASSFLLDLLGLFP